jgi:hypothetical protein
MSTISVRPRLHERDVRPGGFGERELLADDRIERSVLEASDETRESRLS